MIIIISHYTAFWLCGAAVKQQKIKDNKQKRPNNSICQSASFLLDAKKCLFDALRKI